MAKLKSKLKRLLKGVNEFFSGEPIDEEEAMKQYMRAMFAKESRKRQQEKQRKALLEFFGLSEQDLIKMIEQGQQQEQAK
jgi:hypothetical protein